MRVSFGLSTLDVGRDLQSHIKRIRKAAFDEFDATGDSAAVDAVNQEAAALAAMIADQANAMKRAVTYLTSPDRRQEAQLKGLPETVAASVRVLASAPETIAAAGKKNARLALIAAGDTYRTLAEEIAASTVKAKALVPYLKARREADAVKKSAIKAQADGMRTAWQQKSARIELDGLRAALRAAERFDEWSEQAKKLRQAVADAQIAAASEHEAAGVMQRLVNAATSWKTLREKPVLSVEERDELDHLHLLVLELRGLAGRYQRSVNNDIFNKTAGAQQLVFNMRTEFRKAAGRRVA